MSGTHPRLHLPAADLAPMQHHADPLADETIAKILGPWPPGCVATDAPQWAHINTVNLLFSQRDYLSPIPLVQIRLNPQLKQNPGW